MIIIGLMSGTSVDCIDAVVAKIQGAPPTLTVETLAFTSQTYTPALREVILRNFRPETSSVDEICELNFAIGEAFGAVAHKAAAAANLDMAQVDLIVSHGQTLWHAVSAEGQVDSTLQLGTGAVIAERTGVTTISDLRSRDVAAGGQGAPMVSYPDLLLYFSPSLTRALQNIGGIGNVTILPKDGQPALAFDTGPGNMIMDYVTHRATDGQQQFDADGKLAAQGTVNESLVAELLTHPYFSLRPPKTTGRELFGDQYGQQVWERGVALGMSPTDIIATATAFTAVSIAQAYAHFAPVAIDQVIVGGGGGYNPVLMQMLRTQLAPTPVLCQEDLGFSSKAKEALAFAIMGYEAIHGRPGNLPSCTGARRAVPLGQITPGENYLGLMRQVLESV